MLAQIEQLEGAMSMVHYQEQHPQSLSLTVSALTYEPPRKKNASACLLGMFAYTCYLYTGGTFLMATEHIRQCNCLGIMLIVF